MNSWPSPGGKLSGYSMRWFPGLFLANDFTVPGAATKQGRRQKPSNRTEHSPPKTTFKERPSLSCRRPPSVRDFRRGKQQKPPLGRVDVPIDHSSIRGPYTDLVSRRAVLTDLVFFLGFAPCKMLE